MEYDLAPLLAHDMTVIVFETRDGDTDTTFLYGRHLEKELIERHVSDHNGVKILAIL